MKKTEIRSLALFAAVLFLAPLFTSCKEKKHSTVVDYETLEYTIVSDDSDIDYSPIIDSAAFDIDGDGVKEDCFITFGPTSGLFTVTISAYVNGEIQYKNTFNLRHGTIRFCEKDGIPCVLIGMHQSGISGVIEASFHRIHVVDNRIVIDDLKYDYWGDEDYNFGLK